MTRAHVRLILVFVLILTSSELADATEWLQGNRMRLRPGGFEGQSLITMELAEGGDVLVRHETKDKDGVNAVTLLLVGGKALAVAGGELPSGTELELLDSSGLQVQLVEQILSRAFPAGPSSVKGHEKIAIREKKEPIRIGTTGAKGYFSAPWTATGEAKELAPNKIGFDLRFSFRPQESTKKTETLKFAGIWQRAIPPPRFDDRLSLEGWKIYLLGTRTDQQRPTYAAVPADGYRTLGALRQALQTPR